ncbi:MAG: hypothetical protein WBV82_11205 [Myxococcaceae bacterium]
MNASSHMRGYHPPVKTVFAPLAQDPASAPPPPRLERRLSGKRLNELSRPSKRIEAHELRLTAAIDAVIETMAGTGPR